MAKSMELEMFAPECDFIAWCTWNDVYKALRTHYLEGRTESEQEFADKCMMVWKKKKSLNLIDGNTMTELQTGRPYDDWMRANTKIIINALSPDIWSTDDPQDVPDFMRVEKFGLFHAGTQTDYVEGRREHRLAKVSKQFGLKSVIGSYDTDAQTCHAK